MVWSYTLWLTGRRRLTHTLPAAHRSASRPRAPGGRCSAGWAPPPASAPLSATPPSCPSEKRQSRCPRSPWQTATWPDTGRPRNLKEIQRFKRKQSNVTWSESLWTEKRINQLKDIDASLSSVTTPAVIFVTFQTFVRTMKHHGWKIDFRGKLKTRRFCKRLETELHMFVCF